MADERIDRNRGKDSNPDPITGAPGSHPVGTGVGAAGGGAAGAAIGSIAGPVGTVIGAVAGAIAGGLAGKGAAEMIDPTAEDTYWQENYKTRPYYQPGVGYDELAPAYRYGWEARAQSPNVTFEQREAELRQDWDRKRGDSRLPWDKAKMAVRDAWNRVEQKATTGNQNMTREIKEGETRVPIVQEELHVGKREVERGGAQLKTRIEERPVEEQVKLREERTYVERRPVDRPATPADIDKSMQEGRIEVTERSEVPVVKKEARVVEEVVVGKETTERTEKIRDTVRRTDVEVQQDDSKRRNPGQ